MDCDVHKLMSAELLGLYVRFAVWVSLHSHTAEISMPAMSSSSLSEVVLPLIRTLNKWWEHLNTRLVAKPQGRLIVLFMKWCAT